MTLNFHSGRHMKVEALTIPPANLLVHLAPRSTSEWCLSHKTADGSCYPIVRGLNGKAQAKALAQAIPVGLGFGSGVGAHFPVDRPWYKVQTEDEFNDLADLVLSLQEPLCLHLHDRARFVGCSITDFEVLGRQYEYGVCWLRDPLPYQYVFREGVWQTPKSVRYGVEMFVWGSEDGCHRFTVPEEMLPEFP